MYIRLDKCTFVPYSGSAGPFRADGLHLVFGPCHRPHLLQGVTRPVERGSDGQIHHGWTGL